MHVILPEMHDDLRCVEVETGGCDDLEGTLDAVKGEFVRALEQAEGRPIAARVRLVGRGPAHPEIARDPAKTTAEIQNLANELGPASAWVERVEIETRSPIDLEAVARRGDALGQLVRGLGELKRDEPALLDLTAELRALAAVLPAELREGPEAMRLDDPETYRRLLEGIEQGLVPRLLDDGDGS